MDLKRGMRDKLDKYVNVNMPIDILMNISGYDTYDFCCFGVDVNDRLADERYMIFYNQQQSPNNEIMYASSGNSASFRVYLSAIPKNINKLVFTASIDGNTTMGNINSHLFTLGQGGDALRLQLGGSDFNREKAIIVVEIYRKDGWRINAIARGFNGGLGDLLRSYGGQEATPTPTPPPPPKPMYNQQPQYNQYQQYNQKPQYNQYQQYNQQPQYNPKPQYNQYQQYNNHPMNSYISAPTPTPAPAPVTKISLKKGEKVSLEKTNSTIIIENGWTAVGKDYDLKALVRYRNGRLIYVGAANRDEVMQTPEGAVRHGGDIKSPGELEHIEIKWHPDIASVAVSSYSALENGIGSFKRYGVFVRIRNGRQIVEIPARSTSANERSYTLCFGEIIFGMNQGEMEVSALEMYSRPNSENRIGYRNGQVVMDIGPLGQTK